MSKTCDETGGVDSSLTLRGWRPPPEAAVIQFIGAVKADSRISVPGKVEGACLARGKTILRFLHATTEDIRIIRQHAAVYGVSLPID